MYRYNYILNNFFAIRFFRLGRFPLENRELHFEGTFPSVSRIEQHFLNKFNS
jgi:hypothetical protein